VRWKTFNNFAANLLRKLCTNFYQNRIITRIKVLWSAHLCWPDTTH